MLVVASISLMKKAKRQFHRRRLLIPTNAVRNDLPTLSRVEPSTQESGREASVMDSGTSSGLTVPSMRENGARTEPTVKDNSCTWTETSTMDSGLTIRLTD
jgi:hypothetical protein